MSFVSLNPRDVTFTFTDSCNCCNRCFCLKKKRSKDDHIYINTHGNLEDFSRAKAKKNIEEAFERAKLNLFVNLKDRITLLNGNPEEFYEKAEGILASIDALGKIHVSHINGINDLMLEFLKSKTGENQ